MNVSLSSHAIYHARRHASDFSPGSVTYRRGHGAENMDVGFISNVQLVGFMTSSGIGCQPDE